MKSVRVFFILFFFICGGCTEGPNAEDFVDKIDTDFVWDLNNPNRSPEIHLSKIPNETNRIDLHFFDATNEWEHGGGSVIYDGSSIIPAGALNGFKGISSSWGVPKIRLVVEAFDEESRLIGKGVITKTPPES